MVKFEEVFADLERKGFSIFNYTNDLSDLLHSLLNDSSIYVDKDYLQPEKENFRNIGAWSNIYHDNEFPLHTDFAYKEIPPRYIVLQCLSISYSSRPTYILDWNLIPSDITKTLINVVWKINHKERNCALKLWSPLRDHNVKILRYDPVCMKPYFKKNSHASEIISNVFKTYSDSVFWEVNKCVIFDNWRCFHGRGINHSNKNDNKEDRLLARYSIYIK